MSSRNRRVLALAAGVVVALLAAFGVLAADGGPSDKVIGGTDVVIPAGTTIDHDLYAFGSTVTVAGTVNGDLVVGAARIIIDGTVTGDVFAGGSDVVLRGTVGGDFRAAAAQVSIFGSVGEDAAIAASMLTLESTGRIRQDALFTATTVLLDGNIAGGISGSATDYKRTGTIGGPEQVTLATRLDQPPADRTAALALDALRQYIVVVLLGLAFLRFAPGLFRASANRVRSQPLIASGAGVVGILGYVGIMIALVVLSALVGLSFGELGFGSFVAIDIIGAVLAGLSLTLGLVVFAAYFADAIVGLAVGRLVAISDGSRWADAIRLAIGAFIVVVTTSFPDVGGIVKLLVVLVALGAMSSVIWQARQRPAVTMPIPPAAT